MHISIEKGKTLIIRLMAVGPVVETQSVRDVWFEVNGEVLTVAFYISNNTDFVGRFELFLSKTVILLSKRYPERRRPANQGL